MLYVFPCVSILNYSHVSPRDKTNLSQLPASGSSWTMRGQDKTSWSINGWAHTRFGSPPKKSRAGQLGVGIHPVCARWCPIVPEFAKVLFLFGRFKIEFPVDISYEIIWYIGISEVNGVNQIIIAHGVHHRTGSPRFGRLNITTNCGWRVLNMIISQQLMFIEVIWLVVWNIVYFPNWKELSQLTNIFQRGRYTTNQ